MQKLINGTDLYVFDLTPFEITQQTGDAEVIYVQNECIDGYKELNASLADKIKGFNQFVMCVTDPWANGVEPSPEPPTPTTYTLTLTGNAFSEDKVTVSINQEQVEIQSTYSLEENDLIEIWLTEDSSYYTLVSGELNYSEEQGAHYWGNMPASDKTVELTYTEPQPEPIVVDVTIDDTIVEFNSEYAFDDSATYYPFEQGDDPTDRTKAFFVVNLVGATTDNDVEITMMGEDTHVTFAGDHYDVYFGADGSVDFAKREEPQSIEVAFAGDAIGDGLDWDPEYTFDPTASYGAGAMFILNCDSGKTTSDFTYNNGGADISITPVDVDTSSFIITFNESGTATFNKVGL